MILSGVRVSSFGIGSESTQRVESSKEDVEVKDLKQGGFVGPNRESPDDGRTWLKSLRAEEPVVRGVETASLGWRVSE